MLTRERDDRGAVAIIVAVTATILFITAALVVDLGLARDTKRQSQNTADASALAAANALYPDSGTCTLDPSPAISPCYQDAVAAAKSYAQVNFGVTDAQWSACTDGSAYYVPAGSTSCVSFTDDTLTDTVSAQPNKVRVVVPTREVETGLGNLAGVQSIDVATGARAALDPGQARSCGLCILGTDTNYLGNGDVTVTGGSVHSNGTIDTGPNGHLTATPLPNNITISGTCPGNCSPVPETGVPTIEDPYKDVLTFPLTYSPTTVKTSPCTQGPGVYGALELPNSSCTLAPGTYVLTGKWTMKNNTVLKGNGVTLYGTCGTTAVRQVCTSGQTGGGLDTKNGETQLVAPTTGTYAGFVVIYDPLNKAGLNLQGNGASYVTGAVYAASALLEFPGNSTFTVTNGPLIVGGLYGNGNTGGVDLTSLNSAAIPSDPDGVRLDQ